jgi:hypothetical protein
MKETKSKKITRLDFTKERRRGKERERAERH